MKRVSLSDAKSRLGECIRQVKKGEEIIILERSRPVAKLVKIEEADKTDEDLLRELESDGVVMRPAVSLRRDFFTGRKLIVAGHSTIAALLEERSEGDR